MVGLQLDRPHVCLGAHISLLRLHRHHGQRFLGRILQIEALVLQIELTRIRPSRHQKGIDQRFRPLGRPQARFHRLSVFRNGSIPRERQFRMRVNDRQRGSQLVGRIRCEPNLSLKGRLQTVESLLPAKAHSEKPGPSIGDFIENNISYKL
jgi:hypothetical protein